MHLREPGWLHANERKRAKIVSPRIPTRAIVLAASLSLTGCGTPSSRIDEYSAAHGYEKRILRGTEFSHVSYFKQGNADGSLHVYVEHDGTPWTTTTRPAADPTPHVPLMLEQMRQDAAPVLYLGRPCYFGTADVAPCGPAWWTHRRFSPEVVDSMSVALIQFLSSHTQFRTVELIGYSGGGNIAALMAERLPQATRLVTVAAPLDLDAWTTLHGYTPMEGSLNPVNEVAALAGMSQLHVAGSRDAVVPPEIVRSFADRSPTAEYMVIEGFDHYCCWGRIWRQVILRQ